jgi:hypothetical protein
MMMEKFIAHFRRGPEVVAIRGLLSIAVVCIILSVTVNFYSAYTGFTRPVQFTQIALMNYPSLPGFIVFESAMEVLIAVFGTYLFFAIWARARRTRKLAIAYFTFILIYGVLDAFLGYLQFGGNSEILSAAFKGGGQIRMVVYATLGLAYFMASRRVRVTFEGASEETAVVSSEAITEVESPAKPTGKYEEELTMLESLAFELDQGCREGQVARSVSRRAKKYLDQVADEIMDSRSVENRSYIVYEVQALLAWIKHNEPEARELVAFAATEKGDDILFTQTANMILRKE